MMRFKNQRAIVVGGARGIGQGIAFRLAKEGAEVFILDILEKELALSLERAGQNQWNIHGRILDVRNAAQIKSVLREINRPNPKIDILVNAAGIVGQSATNILDYEDETFLNVMDVNLTGAYYLTKYVLPYMLPQKYGRILHISSIGGKEGNPGMVGYAASKAGLFGLVKGVGKEYATQGITVNGLAPAVISTDMNKDTDPKMLEYMSAKIPMGRLGTIEEAVSISCWIVSKEASFNTGFVFDLSGGRATY